MKYAPKKVFILENNEYVEITYEELCYREATDKSYEDKLFLPLHGMLMEVTEDVYVDFYRDQRRQQYITARSIANGDVSYDALNTDEFNGEDTLVDPDENVAEQVAQKMLIEKLHRVLPLLSEDEQLLIHRHYFEDIPETELAEIYGITQQGISKRIKKIREKLKKLLEN